MLTSKSVLSSQIYPSHILSHVLIGYAGLQVNTSTTILGTNWTNRTRINSQIVFFEPNKRAYTKLGTKVALYSPTVGPH